MGCAVQQCQDRPKSPTRHYARIPSLTASRTSSLPRRVVLILSGTAVDRDGNDDSNNNNNSNIQCDGLIELPECLIPLHLSSTLPSSGSVYVDVSIVDPHQCPDATRVFVQPLTLDDYSAVSNSAKHLERGGWLQQISVVYPHQILCVSVVAPGTTGGHTNNRPPPLIEMACVRVVPWDGTPQKGNDRTPSPCLRLVASTELIVVPPPKSPDDNKEDEAPIRRILRIVPGYWDGGETLRDLARRLGMEDAAITTCVSLGCAVVHPTSWLGGGPDDDNDDNGHVHWAALEMAAPTPGLAPPVALVALRTSDAVPRNGIGTYQTLRGGQRRGVLFCSEAGVFAFCTTAGAVGRTGCMP